MAKYQRDFLVTYLRDISALQLALHKLQEQSKALDQQKRSLEENLRRGEFPVEPRYEASDGVFSMGLGGYLFMFSVSMFVFKQYFLGGFCILAGILALMIGVIRYSKVNRENAQKENRYNQRLAVYHETQKKHDHARKTLPELEKELVQCQQETQRLQEALACVYEANIIPEHYQNLHTALLLYIWFETGKSNKLDMTKEILLDDQIRKKLDQFIANKRESILKQYLHFSKKLSSPEALRKYTIKLDKKLEHTELPEEDRNDYLAMVQANAATIAFFANAKYLAHK
jgi:hypothetical protein